MSTAVAPAPESSRAAAWMYRGIWKVLVDIFRVPHDPPTLPAIAGEQVQSFKPAPGFLRYLKFWFWLLLWPMDIAILVGWIAITVAAWWLGLLLLPLALFLAIAPDVLVYVGLHLRYDTTWYVMTNRSLRIRRGIWIIHETTITFENIQNLKVQQGPVQRHYGIANLIVETAGAGGDTHKKGGQMITNQGIIEGVSNVHELRDRILARMRESKSAGLGDEAGAEERQRAGSSTWTTAHLEALRAVRDEIRAFRTI